MSRAPVEVLIPMADLTEKPCAIRPHEGSNLFDLFDDEGRAVARSRSCLALSDWALNRGALEARWDFDCSKGTER